MRDTSLVVKQPFAKDVYISAKSATYVQDTYTYICRARRAEQAQAPHAITIMYTCVVCDYLYPPSPL